MKIEKSNLIKIVFIHCLIVFTGCIECRFKYISNEYPINEQIQRVTGIVTSDGNKLSLTVETCNSYGNDKCNDMKLISSSIRIYPFFLNIKDTLSFLDKIEARYIYGGSNFRENWRNTKELNVKLFYQTDSFGLVNNNEILIVLKKKKTCDFSAH